VTQDNDKWTFNHNTVGGGNAVGTSVQGVGAENGSTWPAATIASIRSNLIWRPASGTAELAHSHASATVANNAVTAADYNATYNVTGTVYGAPSGQYASTPGTHDLSGNPQWVDQTRSLLSFDQGYSLAAVGTAWATSTSYSVGDIRSTSVSTFYNSRPTTGGASRRTPPARLQSRERAGFILSIGNPPPSRRFRTASSPEQRIPAEPTA
jgi:hypothetical protein